MADNQTTKQKPKYYDRKAAAEFRRTSVSTIIRDEQAGLLKPYRFPGRRKVLYLATQVEAEPEPA